MTQPIFERVEKLLAAVDRKRDEAPELLLPDAFSRFPHPQNRSLFEHLKRTCDEALERQSGRALIGDYPFLTHPDLIERFRSFAPTGDVTEGSVYGVPIMLNRKGIVFAWASGMNQIFVRLPRELQQQAINEGGRFDPTYGEDWIGFLAFRSRQGTHLDADEALVRWVRIAHQESLKLEAESS